MQSPSISYTGWFDKVSPHQASNQLIMLQSTVEARLLSNLGIKEVSKLKFLQVFCHLNTLLHMLNR